MYDGKRHHVQVFKIKETILSIVLSTKGQEWDWNPRHPCDFCLKPAPLNHSAILPVDYVDNSIHDGRRYDLQMLKTHETILCTGLSTK